MCNYIHSFIHKNLHDKPNIFECQYHLQHPSLFHGPKAMLLFLNDITFDKYYPPFNLTFGAVTDKG